MSRRDSPMQITLLVDIGIKIFINFTFFNEIIPKGSSNINLKKLKKLKISNTNQLVKYV